MSELFYLIIGLTCGWIIFPSKREKKALATESGRSPFRTIDSRREELLIVAQASEDKKMSQEIENAAQTMYQEWQECEPITIGGNTYKKPPLLIRPFRSVYFIHHEPTARYIGKGSLSDMVHKRFNELKKLHENE